MFRWFLGLSCDEKIEGFSESFVSVVCGVDIEFTIFCCSSSKVLN
jgi:hypothetical protein